MTKYAVIPTVLGLFETAAVNGQGILSAESPIPFQFGRPWLSVVFTAGMMGARNGHPRANAVASTVHFEKWGR
jgi:hypothetical protein